MATDRLINKDQGDSMITALGNIATNINTITYGPQTSADKVVSMTGYQKSSAADPGAISQGDTLNEAVGKLEKKVDNNATAIADKIESYTDATTSGHVVTFNNSTGTQVTDSGVSIATSTTGVTDVDTTIPTSKSVVAYAATKDHTHNYAGSSSAGGAATSADKLNIGSSNIGSATQPVYFDKTTGKPVAITNTIQSNVPADAVFTDTTYTVATGTQNGKIKVTPSVGSAYEVPVYGLGAAAYKGVADTVSTSTDLVTSTAVNTKLASYVPNSDLVEVVNDGAKNVVNCYDLDAIKAKNTAGTWSGTTYTTGNTIFTIYSDGTIGVKTNGQTTQTTLSLPVPTLEAGSYVLSGCPEGGTEAQTNGYLLDYQFVRNSSTVYIIDTGDGREFTYQSTDSNQQLLVMVRNQTTISTEILYKPMICAKAQFGISNKYEPYALGNQVLTPELIELCDSGAKNLFTTSLPTQEFNVTAVSESDTTGTISCKSNGAWARMAHKIILPAGSYIVSFKVTAHGSNSVIFGDSQFDGLGTHLFWCENLQNTSYTVSITTTSTATWYLAFAVNQSNTSSTTDVLTVTDFMVCTKAAFGVSSKFVPYRPNWDLVVDTLDRKLNAKTELGSIDMNDVIINCRGTASITANAPVTGYCFVDVIAVGYDVKQQIQKLSSPSTYYVRHRRYQATSPYYSWTSWFKYEGTEVTS